MAKKKATIKKKIKRDLRKVYSIGIRSLTISGLVLASTLSVNQNFNADVLISSLLAGAVAFFIEFAKYKDIDTKEYLKASKKHFFFP